MPPVIATWGDWIAVEEVDGVPFRMYAERPRRIESLLPLASRWGARPHIVQGDRVVSFAGLQAAVAAKAAALRALGLKPGDRVFLVGWNSPEWVVNFWACLAGGTVPVLGNAWWTAAELTGAVAALQPALVLADAGSGEKVPDGAKLGPWEIDTSGSVRRDWRDGVPAVHLPEEETAVIIFTSGTSGEPKAVVLSHRAVLARLHMTLHVTRKLPHQVEEAAHDVTLVTGPLFHVGGMQGLLRAVVVGDTLVLPRGRYDPGEVLDLIERHKVRRWNAVPTMVSRLLDRQDIAQRDLGSLKSISVGGAPVPAELMQRMRTGLPGVSPRVPTGYGLTENGGQATASAGAETPGQLGSTGRPMPCVEIRFLEHPGLPDAEILLRSPTQMTGYFGLEESPIDREGWLHTGDLGRLDEKGNLWITGRCKEMIIRGGENIAPAAVERALAAVPGVAECAVFGVPHPDLGEEVMAVVVVDGGLTPDRIAEHLRTNLASFAVPSRWHLQRERLPTNQVGKIDKKALMAQILRPSPAIAGPQVRSFQHITPPLRLFAGPDSLAQLGRELDRLECRRAVIFCGSTLGRAGSPLELVRAALGDRCAGVFSGVRAHSPVPAVEAGARELKRLEADAVIAVGGGSAIVTARAASILLAEPGEARALCTTRDAKGDLKSPKLLARKLPQLLIPTTPTTATAKAGSAVFDPATQERLALFDPKTRAHAVFIQPDLLQTAPRGLVVSASLNALAMAIEGLMSRTGDSISDALLMHSLRLLLVHLPAGDDPAARGELVLAALLCGQGTDYTGAGITTVLGHAVGARFQVENGVANAIVLPHALRFNGGAAAAGLSKVAAAFGSDAIPAVEALLNRLGIPRQLRDIGVPREALAGIAATAMGDWFLRGNPRPVLAASELEQVLKESR